MSLVVANEALICFNAVVYVNKRKYMYVVLSFEQCSVKL